MNGIFEKSQAVLQAYKLKGWKIALAESCTGGLVSAAITEMPGSSSILDRAFITYSNEAKIEVLDVDPHLIEIHGAVSREVARAMSEGALLHSLADIAVSITGIAGPDGGTVDKPVGFVWFGISTRGGETLSDARNFKGDRSQIRQSSVEQALSYLLAAI